MQNTGWNIERKTIDDVERKEKQNVQTYTFEQRTPRKVVYIDGIGKIYKDFTLGEENPNR